MLDYSLRPDNRGKDMEGSLTYMRDTYPQIRPWLDSLQRHQALRDTFITWPDGIRLHAFYLRLDSLQRHQALRDTFITSPDGIRLHAFYVRASRPRRETAIIVHGYTDHAIRMFHIGYLYNRSLDYNILLPDLRYTGLSEGDAIQMGWLDRKVVMQWMNAAPSLFGDSLQAVVHGISMGAATTMMVSGETLPPFIRGFVDLHGGSHHHDGFRRNTASFYSGIRGRLRIHQRMGPV